MVPEGKDVCCLISRKTLLHWLPDMNSIFSLSEELRTSFLLGMAMVLCRGALVLILSIASWLQCKTFNLLVQILHPAGKDFLASTTELWAFPVQIHEKTCMIIVIVARPLVGLLRSTVMGSRFSSEFMQYIAMGSRPLAGFSRSLVCGQTSCAFFIFDSLGDH